VKEELQGNIGFLLYECATSPAELGRDPECRAGQVMVEWPEADDTWSMDDITVLWVKKTSSTPRRLTFPASYSSDSPAYFKL